jgi:hypothetical protein
MLGILLVIVTIGMCLSEIHPVILTIVFLVIIVKCSE